MREPVQFLMPRANNARGRVHGALPRIPARGTPPETPARFPFCSIFQNGPRRPGFASPRTNRAPWTAPGRSGQIAMRRKSGQKQTVSASGPVPPPVGRPRAAHQLCSRQTFIGRKEAGAGSLRSLLQAHSWMRICCWDRGLDTAPAPGAHYSYR